MKRLFLLLIIFCSIQALPDPLTDPLETAWAKILSENNGDLDSIGRYFNADWTHVRANRIMRIDGEVYVAAFLSGIEGFHESEGLADLYSLLNTPRTLDLEIALAEKFRRRILLGRDVPRSVVKSIIKHEPLKAHKNILILYKGKPNWHNLGSELPKIIGMIATNPTPVLLENRLKKHRVKLEIPKPILMESDPDVPYHWRSRIRRIQEIRQYAGGLLHVNALATDRTERMPLYAFLFHLAHSHGLFTTGRVFPNHSRNRVGGKRITGPAALVPTRMFWEAHEKRRGFWKRYGANELVFPDGSSTLPEPADSDLELAIMEMSITDFLTKMSAKLRANPLFDEYMFFADLKLGPLLAEPIGYEIMDPEIVPTDPFKLDPLLHCDWFIAEMSPGPQVRREALRKMGVQLNIAN